MAEKSFAQALNEQISNEFAASQQYIGAAVYYDSETLPQLAAFFYRQAVEERNHAMIMVQYLLDAGEEVEIPDIKSQQTHYDDVVGPVKMALDQEKRADMMKEHTEAALPYHKTVKRKLYHSTGLDDLDFITYFETSKLEDFHSLILSLEKVREYQYTRRFGHPTWLGTAKGLDEIIEILAQ